MEGARGAVGVIVGKAAARAIPQQLGLPTTGSMGLATMLGAALGLGFLADKFARRDAPFIVAGALTAPIEGLVRDLNIPVLSPALASYPAIMPGQENLLGTGPVVGGNGRSGLAAYARAYEMPSA